MNFILDIIIAAIIIIFVILAAKKGFVKSFVEFAGFILAIYLAVMISSPVSRFVYDKVVEPSVTSVLTNVLETKINDTQNAAANVWDSLPDYVTNTAERFNISPENISVSGNSANETAASICNNVVEPVALSVIKTISSLILFVVFAIASKFLAKFLNKIFSFKLIGTANRILGGVLGFVQGSVISIVFILVVMLLISLTGGFLIFTNEAVNSSVIFKFILGLLNI